MKEGKREIITFKVDVSLVDAMKGIPNRSEFIRSAIQMALENNCPLCRGTGTLTPHQMEHWRKFSQDHAAQECNECHEIHLVCTNEPLS